MLEVRSISFSYGQARALEDVSLTLAPGEVACLLGMNGAGKTTLLNIISGLLRPSFGKVLLDGAPAPRGAAARVAAGVVQAPEGRQVFAPLTVRENLEMGAYLRLRSGKKAEVARDMEKMFDLLDRKSTRLNSSHRT